MLFASVLGLLLGAAAMGLEPLLAARRRPRRAAWVAALLLGALWPAAVALTGGTSATGRVTPAVVSPLAVPLARASAYVARASAGRLATRVDALLLVSWATATLLLLVRLGAGRRRLERERRGWDTTSLDGIAVRLSHEIGPAVVGVQPMEIVLPRWTLTLDRPLRALVLRHEEEHRAARDPHLLLLAALVVALVPWNLALWWHARRLRLAIEMDCDARVLRSDPRPDRYGLLLLAIAQRSGVAPRIAPALSEPVADLERRVIAFSTPATGRPRLAACGAFALFALGVACSLEAPTAVTRTPSASAASRAASEQPYREFRLTKEAVPLPDNRGPRYPDALRSARVEGEVVLQFVIDQAGRVDMTTVKVLRSTHPQFTAAVRRSLEGWRFEPAEVGGRPVKQLVQVPFEFALSP